MNVVPHAILAVMMILSAPIARAQEIVAPPPDGSTTAPAETEAETERPVYVTFRLADGVRVRGHLSHWDDTGIDGTFAPRRWVELHHDDVWKLYRRLFDREDPAQWVALGRLMLFVALEQPDGAKRSTTRAEQAFETAVRRDPAAAELVAAAYAELEAERTLRAEEAKAEREWELKTTSPEGDHWSADAWPPLTPAEQEGAVLQMKADAQRILEQAGLQLKPVETEFFLFYSDMDRAESAKWASELDTMYRLLARRFGVDETQNIFWGKTVIFVFKERDRFRLVEATAFNHFVPEWADGLFHPMGPRCFVNFYRQPREEIFAAVLVHETTHAFMHRYRSPRRLPTWANEGICDYMAAVLFERSVVDLDRRRQGVRWVRQNGDVNDVLAWKYQDGTWPGPNEIGYNIGYLMVELMIRDRADAFGDWVDAIKDGKDWETALAEDFGVGRRRLVDVFTQYYRIND